MEKSIKVFSPDDFDDEFDICPRFWINVVESILCLYQATNNHAEKQAKRSWLSPFVRLFLSLRFLKNLKLFD